jgi:hypothetical protein
MTFIVGAPLAIFVSLLAVLMLLRNRPSYLRLWLWTWATLLACSAVSSSIAAALIVKWRQAEVHGIPYPGPPGGEFWIPLLLVLAAGYLFACAVAAFGVLPPRATWPRRLFTNIIQIIGLAVAVLLLLVVLVALVLKGPRSRVGSATPTKCVTVCRRLTQFRQRMQPSEFSRLPWFPSSPWKPALAKLGFACRKAELPESLFRSGSSERDETVPDDCGSSLGPRRPVFHRVGPWRRC